MSKTILLDTQLMVLLVAGLTSRTIIRSHKRLAAFTGDDLDLLLFLLGPDPRLMLLPNIVTETGNLLGHHREPERTMLLRSLAAIVTENQEQYIRSLSAVRRPEFRKLGVTDSAILECCTDANWILTADLGLYLAAAQLGLEATNFNHKREEFGLA